MTDTTNWKVDPVSDAPDVHVLPTNPDGTVACGHLPLLACPACRPEAVREGPLDSPVWSHNEPNWPGANRGLMT